MLHLLFKLKIIALIILCSLTSILLGDQMNADDVVKQIEYNERLIQDVQCKLNWFETESGFVIRECEWGYKNGKEYVSGTEYVRDENGKPTPLTRQYGFDGKVTRSYMYVPFSGDSKGGIYGYDPRIFSIVPSPKTLLGYTLSQDGLYTLSELLSDEYVKEKNVGIDNYNGTECIVLEAMSFQTNTSIYDVRIWIDPERNYRPLKIEAYQSPEDSSTAAALKGEKWTYLSHEIKNIELKQVDGIWFPVGGEQMVYKTEPEFLKNGMTEEEVRIKYPGMTDEEILKKGKFITAPFQVKRRIEAKEIRINKGIDPAKFTIVFPHGCKLWDDIAGLGYVVGDPEGVTSSTLDDLNKKEVAGQHKSEYTPQPFTQNLQDPKSQEKDYLKRIFPEKQATKKSFNMPIFSKNLVLIASAICLLFMTVIFLVRKMK